MNNLSAHQEEVLHMVFDSCPELTGYQDLLQSDGGGRNPTFRKLTQLGLVEYKQYAGNTFKARLTEKGILYLHGEQVNLDVVEVNHDTSMQWIDNPHPHNCSCGDCTWKRFVQKKEKQLCKPMNKQH